MSEYNKTDFTNPSTIILLGFPGLEEAQIWISIAFCTMYIIAIFGSFTILFIVKVEQSLHEPMYYFLCMLAITDLIMHMTTMPKMLSIFWFNSREIDFSACLTQVYLIAILSPVESGILVAMAFDRYVAICHPLRHATILKNILVVKICLAVVMRATMLCLPFPFLARQWPYCRTNVIPQPYCGQIYLENLACADTRVSNYYGLFVTVCVMGLDGIFIAVSYTEILRAIFRLPTKDARLKTLGTCSSHLLVILTFYIPDLINSLMYSFAQNVSVSFNNLIFHLFFLMPPVLHPIIYGVRTKQIRDRLLQILTHKGAKSFVSDRAPKFPFSQSVTSKDTSTLPTGLPAFDRCLRD